MPDRRLISFDAAGTLIQVSEPVGQTYARLAAAQGIAADPETLTAAFRTAWSTEPVPLRPEGQASPDDDRSWWFRLVGRVFAAVLGEPLAECRLAPLFERLYGHYARPEAWTLFDDVRPALEDLGRDHTLCVLSNFDRRLCRILAGHGLDRHFAAVILSSEVGASKPHPRMFAEALRRLQVPAAHSLHVGDDWRCDVEGARACGWQAFAVYRPGQGLGKLVEKVRLQEIPACVGAFSG